MPELKRVVIAGGTGYLGKRLARHMETLGWEAIILGRNEPTELAAGKFVKWDGRSPGDWTSCLDGATALVNLAGRSVDCVKTVANQDEIMRSRVESTRVLGRALQSVTEPPEVWVQMSTAHIYGDPATAICDEDSGLGIGLAPEVGKAWEAEHLAQLPAGMRSVILRTSFVLGKTDGALVALGRVAKFGLGGTVAGGKQGISWIHEVDMDNLMAAAITTKMSGVYVATAPNPVSNREFMRSLRRAVRRPVGLPAAGWMVKLGAPIMLKTDPELAIYGRYCVSRRLKDEGFKFKFPAVAEALTDIYAK